jgi:ribonuclease BN (tRNA processing enzyme)
MPPYQISFLGTNAWYDTDTGSTICITIMSDAFGIIVDAGNGIHRLGTATHLDRPFCVLLSHLHLDPVWGLHILNKFRFERGLEIFVPEGQQIHLERLLSSPYTINYRDLPCAVSLHELPAAVGLLPCQAEVFLMNHPVPTMGTRLHLDGKVLAYCPDTGFCANALAAAYHADILIAECAYLPGQEHPEWPHLNPESAAHIAPEAGVGRLILVHFDAFNYQTHEKRLEALSVARAIFPETSVASDGWCLSL